MYGAGVRESGCKRSLSTVLHRFFVFLAFLVLLLSAYPQTAVTPPLDMKIRGTVLEPGTNQPVVDAEVLLYVRQTGAVRVNGGYETEPSAKTQTDATGSFSFSPEKLGGYRIEARKPGYFAPGTRVAAGEREVTLSAANRLAEAILYLVRPGRIVGRVVDEENAKPIPNLRLMALRVDDRGRLAFEGPVAITDSDGKFEATGLAPGEYAVEIRAQGAPEKRVLSRFTTKDQETVEQDYEHTYWPGGHGADSVAPVTVSTGLVASVGTLRVRKVPYYRVHVRIPANCERGDTVNVSEVFPSLGGTTTQYLATAPCDNGLLVTGFSPGVYSLFLSVADRTVEAQLSAAVPFSIVDRNIEIVADLSPGITVDGTFVAAEGSKLPELAKTEILLRAVDALGSGKGSPGPDGRFKIEHVAFVDHMVMVTGLESGCYVKELRYNGALITGDVFAFQSVALSHTLKIVVDDKPGVITGTVMDGDQPLSQPYVLARKWPVVTPWSPSGMFFVRGDDAGRFRIAGLPPGQYHVLAVRSFDPATSQATVDRALAAAKAIDVGPGSVQNITLDAADRR
jgi:hypothetical protein